MKKINIFNRNIDLPSYRHMPVSRGIVENRHTAEARCPGIAIAMTCPAGDFSSQGDEKHNVCDASFCIRKNQIPAFAGMTAKICGITMIVIAALFAVPAFADPTAQELLDQKTVTSKYYVDTTKQDKITTDDVLLGLDGKKEEIYVPALVTTDAKEDGGLAGYAFGIVGSGDLGALEWGMSELLSESVTDPDALVPTVRVVADAISDATATLSWGLYNTNATNAYSITFGDNTGIGGTADWPSADATKLIDGTALAQGLALKQNIIAAGTSGNVVTYTGTAGLVGSVAVASTETYNNQNQLTNGSNIANVQLVSTKQDKMTCAGYVPGHENDINYCWLYGDVQVAAAAAPSCIAKGDVCDPNNPNCCSGLSCYAPKGSLENICFE